MTVCYFLWIQLSLGRWKPFLTGCGERYAMLHPLEIDISMTWKQYALAKIRVMVPTSEEYLSTREELGLEDRLLWPLSVELG